jgi:hydroxyacylglutathione hydrolase
VEDVAEELSRVPYLSPAEFHNLLGSGREYTIIDTRKPKDFFSGHIAGSLSFSLGGAGGAVVGTEDGNFAIWVGTLVSSSAELLIVAESGRDGETLQRLSRIAFTNVKGVLKGGIDAYKDAGFALESFQRIDLREPETSLESLLASGHRLIDVRTETEYNGNTATSATNMPLATLPTQLDRLDRSVDYVAFCVSGYRSAIATSLLRKAGFRVRDIFGGFAAINWTAPSHTTSRAVCPRMKAIADSLFK